MIPIGKPGSPTKPFSGHGNIHSFFFPLSRPVANGDGVPISRLGWALGVLILFMALQAQAQTAPSNDNLSDAIYLHASSLSTAQSTSAGTKQSGEPDHAGDAGASSVWWSWIAPVSGTVQLDTIGSDFDTLLAVYTGYDVANLQPVASDDQSGGNNTSSLTFEAFAGHTYQFAVDGYQGATGTATLNLTVANANAAFADAALLSGSSFSVTDANAGAGAEPGEPMHAGEPGGASLWWRWTPQVSGTVVIDTIGSDFDTLLAVYHGTDLNALSPIESDDQSGGDNTSLVSFFANEGIEYFVAVDGWQGATGNIRLNGHMQHDAFGDRLHLIGQRLWLIDSNVGATSENSEPDHAGETGGASVWWSWTPPVSGTARIYTTGSDFDTLLAVYSGTEFASLTELASNDEGGPHHISNLSLNVEAGTTYQIAVDGYNGDTGTISLNISVFNDNDAFANRASLSGTDILIEDDNFSATRETGEPTHADNPGGGSIWWTWTAPHTGATEISTFGSGFDTLLAVYTGDNLNALTVAASDRNIDGFGASEVTFLAEAGVSYHIAIDGADNARGFAQLALVLAPANDAFENASPLSGSFAAVETSSFNATRQPRELPHAGNEGGASLWWSWTAPVSGAVVIDTHGSGFDTTLAVYQGTTLAGLTPAAENDDADSNTLTSSVRLNVIEGEKLFIAVDGFAGAEGDIALTLRIDHDNFANAARLSGAHVQLSDNSSSATTETGEPDHAGAPGGASLWWSWTAPVDGTVQIDTLGSGFDTTLAVYTGSSVDALTEIAANDDGSGAPGPSLLSFNAGQGVEYRIVVDGFNGDSGSVALNLRVHHDAFADAAAIAGSHALLTDSNAGTTVEINEPAHGDAPNGASLWWTWTAPANGATVISTEGSGFDTTLAVYTGSSLTTLTLVAENDDARSDLTSRVEFQAIQSQTYLIAVDGFAGDSGRLRLELTRGPANDDFAARTPLTDFVNLVSAHSIDASAETSEPVHGDASTAGERSVWWTYTPPIDGTLEISTEGSDFDTLLGVYSGDSLANLAAVAQNDDDADGVHSLVSFSASAGIPLQIAVDGFGRAQGNIRLSLTLIPEVNTAPSAALTFPANGSAFDGPTPLTLRADAADSDGIVTSVDFYHGESLLGSVSAAPFVWTTDELPAGSHTFHAEVVDNLGLKTVSPPNNVTIRDAYAPTGSWSLVFPFFPDTQVEPLASFAGIHAEIDADQTVAAYEDKIYYATSLDGTASPTKILKFDPADDSTTVFLQNIDGSRFTSIRELNGELYIADSFGWLTRHDGMSFDYLRPPYDIDGDHITSMAELNTTLYLGTLNGRIFARTPDGEFQLRHTLPSTITSMTQWRGRLHVADRGEDDYSSRIVSTGDGVEWTESAAFNSFAFAGLVATPDRLYAASVENPYSASMAVWTSANGADWERIFFTEEHGRDLQGRPHYSPQTERVYFLSEWTDGVSLFIFHDGAFEERIPMPHGYTSLIEMDGRLYAIGADDATSGYNSPHRLDRLGEYAASLPGNLSPTASLTSPSDGARIPDGQNLNITVDASDPDGSIQRVEFLVNDFSVGSDLEPPFEHELIQPPLGVLRIQARAWDNQGAIGYTDPITVTVAPENDAFANRIPLSGSQAFGSGVNRFAASEPDEPAHANSPGGRSVWWSWTAPFTGRAVASTEDSDFDTLLAAYSGAALDSLTPLAGNDDDGGKLTSLIVFPVVSGETYHLAVDGYNGDAGAVSLVIGRQPDNDLFEDPYLLTGPAVGVSGTNVGASKEAGEPDHAGDAGGRSIWWRWTAPATGNVTLDTRGSAIDTLLAVYTGSSLSTLSPVASNDQDPDSGNASILSFNAAQGTEYLIAVDGYDSDQGDIALNLTLNNLNEAPAVQILTPADNAVFAPLANVEITAQAEDVDGSIEQVYFYLGPDLHAIDDTAPYTANLSGLDGGSYRISAVAKDNEGVFSAFHRVSIRFGPAHDAFANRITLETQDGSLSGSNLGASKESGEPNHYDSPDGASVWYQWTAPENLQATFTLEKSGFDTLLAVYTGAGLDSLTPVAGDDDSGGNLTSAVTFNAVAGTDYHIAVDGYDGASGQIVMNWSSVTATREPPKIVQQPEDRAFVAGATASFAVVATSSAKLAYQWTRNRVELPGATEAMLTIPHVSAEHVGVYRVAVTDSFGAAVISEPANLELGASPNLISRNKFRDGGTGSGPVAQGRTPNHGKDGIIPVSSGALGVQVFSNFDSGAEQGEPMHAGQATGSSRWFTLQPEEDGQMILDTLGSAIDTVLAVYEGSGLANLRLVKSDDNGAPDGVRSRLSFTAKTDTEYQIVVDGVGGQQGTISLNWVLLVPFELQPPTIADGEIRIAIQAKPNVAYTTQVTSDLINWTTFSTDQSATGGELIVTDSIPEGQATRLYRVVILP